MHNTHFRTGVALTALLAIAALMLAKNPFLATIGPLSIALILGIAWRAALHVNHEQFPGIAYSARDLLRLGIVLLGVRLDFVLLRHVGIELVVLDLSIITVGLLLISYLGRRFGLTGDLPLLIAVGSSICGASAIAAVAPVIQAKDRDTNIAIPICTLLGTVAALLFTFAQTIVHLPPQTYGLITGATLHEVAQVAAATASVPDSILTGTVAKLLRVVLLIPVVAIIGSLRVTHRLNHTTTALPKPWFVLGFVIMGILTTTLRHLFPSYALITEPVIAQILTLANFLMAMAMAGLGLQADLHTLSRNGTAVVAVATIGWLALLAVAVVILCIM